MKRNPFILVLVAGIVAGMLWFGMHSARKNAAKSGILGEVRGQVAPDFELDALDGKKQTLSEYRGKAILLNFWATWCGPCKIEMPWFVELQKEYGPQGFQVIGVAMDEATPEEIGKFAQKMGVNYPILVGQEAVGQSYGGVEVLPTTFFIDRDGKVVAREFGLQSRSVFVDHIKQALGQAVQAQK